MNKYYNYISEKDIEDFLRSIGYAKIVKSPIFKDISNEGYPRFRCKIEAKTVEGLTATYKLCITCQNFECEVHSYSNFFGKKTTQVKKPFALFMYNKFKKENQTLAQNFKNDYDNHTIGTDDDLIK